MLPQFRIEESRDADGTLRLTVLGELDLSVAPSLDAQLQPNVRRPLELLGMSATLWPEDA